MKQVVSMIILSVFFSSCFQKLKQGAEIFKDVDPYQIAGQSKLIEENKGLDIHVNYKSIDKNSILKFSDVFDSISYVKLESTSESMIGSVNKMYIKEGFFYILDTYKAKTLKKFDQHGRYVTTFGKIGPGPEEVIEITDFFVSDTGLIIYDQFKSKLFYYSLNGEFLFSKSLPFIALSFFCFSDNEYVFHLYDSDNYHIPDILNYSILKTDSNFVVETKSAFHEKGKYTSHIATNNVVFSNNTFYYHPPFNDTIFSIHRDGSLSYDYIFNFGKNSLPDDLRLKENEKRMNKAYANEEYVIFVGGVVPTENFIYTNFSMQGYLYHSFYSNKSRKSIYGRLILDDMYYSFSLSNIFTSIDDTLIGIADAHRFKGAIDWINREKQGNRLKDHIEFLNSIDDDDNPIIVFYKMKDQL